MRRHTNDDVVEDDVIAGGGVFWLTVVSGFLIEEIYIGTGVSIFSQRGSLLCFLLVLFVYLVLKYISYIQKQMRSFFLFLFFC